MKVIAIALLALATICAFSAHATFEIDGYGVYGFPSGAILDQLTALATSVGVTSKKGGFGGGGSLLYGQNKMVLGGLDIASLPLISFSTSAASVAVNALPILGIVR